MELEMQALEEIKKSGEFLKLVISKQEDGSQQVYLITNPNNGLQGQITALILAEKSCKNQLARFLEVAKEQMDWEDKVKLKRFVKEITDDIEKKSAHNSRLKNSVYNDRKDK